MSSTFAVTRDQVINSSLRKLGVLSDAQTAGTNDLTNCAQALNIMLKQWEQKGYKGWLYASVTFPFVVSQSAYTIGPSGADVTTDRPVRVAQAWWQDSSTNKTPMVPVSREEFLRLTPSNSTGQPTSWYYQPTIATTAAASKGTFNVWPAPIEVNGQSFGISVQRPIFDITSASQEFDVPQPVFAALVWGLADAVGTEYGANERVLMRIEKRANQYIEEAFNFEEEDASVFFQPNPQGGYWNGR